MNREKRVRAPPAHYEIPPVCYPRIRQRQKGKKTKQTSNPPPGPPQQCTYQSIPLPLKFAYVGGVYHFYGGISLHEENGVLRTQTMLLSQCFRCDEVKVIKEHDQNILSMKLFKQPIFQYPPWQPMVETLNRSENAEICRWGAPIREYCLKYEDRLRVLADQEAYRKQVSEDRLIEMNKESEKKIANYFKNYPCINFRAQLDDNQMQFNEIIINDAYLEHVGYSIDTFAVTTLRDGLPQLLPTNNIDAVKVYIDNYCSLAQSDFQSSELTSEIILRKGFVRRVNYKAHYFATYRDGVFGMDCIWMITGRQPPTLSTTLSGTVPSEIELDKKFVKKAVKKEKQAAKFLQQYYNKQYNAKYANMDKVCRIKQIEDDSNSCIVSLNSNYVHVHDFLN